jgi:hypothetical protein
VAGLRLCPRRARLLTAAGIAGAVLLSWPGPQEAHAALAAGFPPSRIKLDPPAVTFRIGTTAAVTATVVDWHGSPLPDMDLSFAIISGPDRGRSLAARTDRAGQARYTFGSAGGPGTDIVQASFSDGLEVHRSNRTQLTWESGPAASALSSPAAISLNPTCWQPKGSAAFGSDSFAHLTPVGLKPSADESEPPMVITVTGVNFNPFTAVLVTFDAASGGHPESVQSKTDGFGRFTTSLRPSRPAEGPHLVRADDFREREATANFSIPCYQPSVALEPAIGPPGFVPSAVGTGFPANQALQLNWSSPAITGLLAPPGVTVHTDGNGAFSVPMLVFYHDILGPRYLAARVHNDKGGVDRIFMTAPFLVTPGRSQPSDFVERR